MDTSVEREDMEYILGCDCIPWKSFENTNIFVTGATGLIGSLLVKTLLNANKRFSLNMKIYCLVRDENKAKALFGETNDVVRCVIGTLEAFEFSDVHFDYIIHGASPTASQFLVQNPVETIESVVLGTRTLLKRAVEDKVSGFLFLSSMEAYGVIHDDRVLTEDQLGHVDLSNVRSCYPEAKRLCELLCYSYSTEYDIRTMSLRLAQTFGPGIPSSDKRVFAMMANCAREGKDIVLLTKGNGRHPYLYSAQAVTAILCVLLKGEKGETYNAANPDTYCSIYEMGKMVADTIADGKISVRIEESDANRKYPPASCLNLSIDKITKLGWKPQGTLADMYKRMIAVMR